MTREQEQALTQFLARFQPQGEFLAALLVGSIAHGHSRADSDIDIILVATEAEYQRRQREGKLTFSLWDLCEYEGGYVDCKVVSEASLELIRERGSDPARYAFQGARILYSRLDRLPALLEGITRYPAEDQGARRHRFLCQLLAWKWYLSQGEAKANAYLITLAVQKIVLFSCRFVLNENLRLYPYHKWLLAETALAPHRPAGLLDLLQGLLKEPTFAKAQTLCDLIFASVGAVEKDTDWPNQFLRDSEQNWLDHEAPVDDL